MAVRTKIASEAADRVLHGSSSWFQPLPVADYWVRPALLAGAAAVVVALLAIPLLLRSRQESSPQERVRAIQVVAQDGVVRLAWSDGDKDFYTVYKGTSPRAFSRKEAHVVKGTVWTDSEPSSSPVVFYQVE